MTGAHIKRKQTLTKLWVSAFILYVQHTKCLPVLLFYKRQPSAVPGKNFGYTNSSRSGRSSCLKEAGKTCGFDWGILGNAVTSGAMLAISFDEKRWGKHHNAF